MKKAVEAVSLTAILYLILSAFAVVLILSRSCLLVKRIHLFVTFHWCGTKVGMKVTYHSKRRKNVSFIHCGTWYGSRG